MSGQIEEQSPSQVVNRLFLNPSSLGLTSDPSRLDDVDDGTGALLERPIIRISRLPTMIAAPDGKHGAVV